MSDLFANGVAYLGFAGIDTADAVLWSVAIGAALITMAAFLGLGRNEG